MYNASFVDNELRHPPIKKVFLTTGTPKTG